MNYNLRNYLYLFFILIGISKYSVSQNYKYIFIENTDTSNIYTQQIIDTILNKNILKIKNKYLNRGYLGVSIDSVSIKNGVYYIYIYKGVKYRLGKVNVSSDLSKNYSKNYLIKPKLTPKLIKKTDDDILNIFINRGYPYTVLDKDIMFENKRATLSYNVDLKQYIYFDSIKTSPENIISYNYISKITGIEYNKPFCAKAINNIGDNINRQKMFILDSAYVEIDDNKSYVTLKLIKQNQNSFSGLIGLQTNSKKETEITGNVFISLVNSFKKGEKIKLEWQKPQNNSQQLETDINIPYIFKLPIGLSFYGNFDKNDTIFTNTYLKVGLLVPILNLGDLSINGKWNNSSVGSSNKNYLNSTKGTLFGIGYKFIKTDNSYLTKKGLLINTEVYLGNNTLINSNTNTTLFEWIGNLKIAQPLPIGVLNINNSWGILKNDSLKINNIYRLGGAKTVRGFNERSIYTKAYSYINTEYRLFIDNNSYLYMLYDIGVFSEPTQNLYKNTLRQAIGAGVSINTKAGILTISYAIGKVESNPFLFDKGQVHIGYINTF
jgi:hypothetical protein